MDGSPAGFSGATFVEKHLWVTVSAENTADPVRDGAVLGSFVGALDLVANTVDFARFTWADGRAYRGKVEGLALRGASARRTPRAAACHRRRLRRQPWWLQWGKARVGPSNCL